MFLPQLFHGICYGRKIGDSFYCVRISDYQRYPEAYRKGVDFSVLTKCIYQIGEQCIFSRQALFQFCQIRKNAFFLVGLLRVRTHRSEL